MGIWWSGIHLTSRSDCGEPCAENLHARFLEEFISIVKSLEGEINLLMEEKKKNSRSTTMLTVQGTGLKLVSTLTEATERLKKGMYRLYED